MKTRVTILLFLCLMSIALGSPTDIPGTELLIRHKRQADPLENARNLIQDLVENLRNATDQSMATMNNFTTGLEKEVSLFQEQVTKDISALRERISNAIENVRNTSQNVGEAVVKCIELQRTDADNLLRETISNIIGCATDRIQEISSNIADLANATSTAIQQADAGLKDARNCTQSSANNILAAGVCLGAVALRVEFQGAAFALKSALAISRISINIATLQSSLQACASQRLLEASVGVGRIILNIGSCSATSIFTILTNGNRTA